MKEKCNCEEMGCLKGCTKNHTCHGYWCEHCYKQMDLLKPMTQEEYDQHPYGGLEVEDSNTIEIDGFKDRFNKEFVDKDTGLLNIDKYDHARLLTWIKNENKWQNFKLKNGL